MICILALSTTFQSAEAIDMALEFVQQKGASLKVIFVLDSGVPGAIFEKLTDIGFIGDKPSQELQEAVAGEYRKQAVAQLEEIRQAALSKGVDCETAIEQGEFADQTLGAIMKYAADMLIISRTRQSQLSRLLVSSAVDKLIRQAPCEIKVFEA